MTYYFTPGSYPFNAWNAFYGGWLEQKNIRPIGDVVGEQITLEEARGHLELDLYGSPGSNPHDDMIEQIYIPSSREYCEMISGRALAPRTFEIGLGAFPWQAVAWSRNGISLQIAPVAGVLSLVYKDGDGVDQTIDPSGFILDPYTEPGYVYPSAGGSWPGTQSIPNAIRLRFNAGYDLRTGSPLDRPLPAKYRLAMLLMLGHVFENRENTSELNLKEIPNGINSLLLPDSLVNGFA